MHPHRLLPLLALLALLVDGATAAPTGHLSASSVEATGASTTTADLAGLYVRHATTPAFTLDADRLTVENHHANVTIALQNQIGSRYNINDNPRTIHDGPGLLTGHDNRPRETLWVLPIEGHAPPLLSASAVDCVTLEPPEKDTVTTRAHVNTKEPDWGIDASRAAAWRTCTDATATLRGDFLLVLWEWDAILTAHGEARTLRTGHHDAYPGTPVEGTIGSADELFITVRGGTLTLPLAPGAHELYIHVPRVEADSWRFTDAAGTLPGVGAVEGTVRVAGSLAATITGTGAGAPLGADVGGHPERVEVNGEPLAVAAPTAGASRISVSLWVAFAVVVAGCAAVAWRMRRPRRASPAVMSEEAPPGAPAPRRDREAEARVLSAVEASPGAWVRELLAFVGVSKERMYRAVDALVADGVVVWVEDGGRRHLFLASQGPRSVLVQLARLRDAKNRKLWMWLECNPGAGWRHIQVVAASWAWSESATKVRLRGLVDVGLAARTGPPKRGTYSALPLPAP